ncbi:PLD nuclease N-terminal domain-containing protein [Alteribacter aurantiacus]|uniref:PLD nuclease N-terminal domain-containing protein n=1 Tax=Alteribacter aurantiacus TaxID=254410 RepID=UPI0004025B30|nr:PLD nuclease N-terminal domain-containing protein [Alteribacter aurantiacus]
MSQTGDFSFLLLPILGLLILFILNIMTSIWAYRDAIRNGKSKEYSLLVLLATLFFPIAGLIVYLIIRRD